jgi:hypothetical protein
MNWKTILLSALCLSLFAPNGSAQLFGRSAMHRPDMVPGVFAEQEFQVDIFGSITAGERARRHPFRHRTLGAGSGFNYFHQYYYGIGLEAYTLEFRQFPEHLSLSAIVRYPMQDLQLAPYLFGGGGRQWQPVSQWTAHVGAGLEYRFARTFGIFGDGRYTFAEHTGDFGLFRAGVRLSW